MVCACASWWATHLDIDCCREHYSATYRSAHSRSPTRFTVSFDRGGFYHQVGLLLSKRRKELQLTQQDVAAKIGIPRATYASIEGGRQRAMVDILWRAAVVLGVSLGDLVPEPILEERGPKLPPGPAPSSTTTAGDGFVVSSGLRDTSTVSH